jgi:hypothetical protein
MLDTVKQLLTNQYAAALCTLGTCIQRCPENAWDVKIGNGPFQWVAFHTLFFTDYYLAGNEQAFRDQQFHRENLKHFGDYIELQYIEPVTTFDRNFIEAYLQHCRQHAAAAIEAETTESFSAPCGFDRKVFSRAELHVSNIRHLQHHTAHLSLRLRLDHEIDIPWIGSGWRETTSD